MSQTLRKFDEGTLTLAWHNHTREFLAAIEQSDLLTATATVDTVLSSLDQIESSYDAILTVCCAVLASLPQEEEEERYAVTAIVDDCDRKKTRDMPR